MELEKEIKQKAFQSQLQKLVINLVYTGNWVEQQVSKQLKQYDITVQQFNVLRILRGQSPKSVTISLIAERMLDKSSNVTRILDKLAAKRLVSREKTPLDNRKVLVKITLKGLDLLKMLDGIMTPPQALLNGLSEEEARIANDILDILRGAENNNGVPSPTDESPSS